MQEGTAKMFIRKMIRRIDALGISDEFLTADDLAEIEHIFGSEPEFNFLGDEFFEDFTEN